MSHRPTDRLCRPRPARAPLVPLVAAAWCCALAGASGQAALPVGDGRASSTPRRLLARLDFEDNEAFPRELPAGWQRVLSSKGDPSSPHQGVPDLPEFGTVRSDHGIGRSEAGSATDPRWALRFEIDGASMAVASDPKRMPVEPGAQLLATAWARTSGLKSSVVRLALQYADADGRPLGEPFASDGFRSEAGWRQLRLSPPPAPMNAAGAIMWLEVVQPRAMKVDESARFAIAEHDIGGTALFDDIEVWQMPTVSFEASADGVFAPGTQPRLLLRCSDPRSAVSEALVRVRDAAGAMVHEARCDVASSRDAVLDLPALPSGWYEAEARYTSGSDEIAVRFARLAVLPRDPFEPEEPPRFGVSLGSEHMPVGPAIGLARAGFVVLPIWSPETEARDPRRALELLRGKVAAVADAEIEPMFRIAGVPSSIARECRLDSDDTLALFALGEDRWRPALEPWLLAFGQDVERWILADAPVEADRPELAERVYALASVLRKSIAGPKIVVPWDPSESLDPELARTLSSGRHCFELVAEPAWRESAGGAYEGFPSGPAGMVRLVPLPEDLVDGRERAIDLALRAIDAWRAGFDDIAVDVRDEGKPTVPGPSLELAAWRQLSTRLCGRRMVTEVPVAEGVRALLADGPRGPALVLWNERGTERAEFEVMLGPGPVLATDLWGRASRVAPTMSGHRLAVGREPIFVEDISSEMCLFRRSFRADPGFATARRAPQDGALVLANPWDMPLQGTLTILAPDELSMSPKSHPFAIDPRGEIRMPVRFGVPRSMEAGPARVRVAIDAVAEEPFRAELEATLEVGFRGVEVDHSWRLARSIESGSVDLVLTLRVTNTGDAPVDVEAFAVADGYAQNKKPVNGLPPGATATRVFHFAEGARRLSGRDIRAGVHDTDADARLLRRIPVPPLLPPTVASVPDRAGVGDGAPSR